MVCKDQQKAHPTANADPITASKIAIKGRRHKTNQFLSTISVAAIFVSASTVPALSQSGANVGSLTCNVAGGIGFVFGSSKELNCLFTRSNGKAERYTGSIKKFGIDIGFTKEAQIVWLVFAPGNIAPGALSGSYGGATASGSVGVGMGANVLLGGSDKQVTLQPVSVEGSVGLNVAAGIGAVDLNYVK